MRSLSLIKNLLEFEPAQICLWRFSTQLLCFRVAGSESPQGPDAVLDQQMLPQGPPPHPGTQTLYTQLTLSPATFYHFLEAGSFLEASARRVTLLFIRICQIGCAADWRFSRSSDSFIYICITRDAHKMHNAPWNDQLLLRKLTSVIESTIRWWYSSSQSTIFLRTLGF